jgi:hypothetical protein
MPTDVYAALSDLAPRDPAPRDLASRDPAPYDPAARDSAARDSAAHDPAAYDAAAYDAAAYDAAAHDLAPGDPVPRDFAPPQGPWTRGSDVGASRVRLTPAPPPAGAHAEQPDWPGHPRPLPPADRYGPPTAEPAWFGAPPGGSPAEAHGWSSSDSPAEARGWSSSDSPAEARGWSSGGGPAEAYGWPSGGEAVERYGLPDGGYPAETYRRSVGADPAETYGRPADGDPAETYGRSAGADATEIYGRPPGDSVERYDPAAAASGAAPTDNFERPWALPAGDAGPIARRADDAGVARLRGAYLDDGLPGAGPGGGRHSAGVAHGGLGDRSGPGGDARYAGPPRVEWVRGDETVVTGGALIDLAVPRGAPVTHRGQSRRRRTVVVVAALGAVLAGGTGYAGLRALGLGQGTTQKNAELPLVTIAPTIDPSLPDDSPSIGIPSSASASAQKSASASSSASASATTSAPGDRTAPAKPSGSSSVVVIPAPTPAATGSSQTVKPLPPTGSAGDSAAPVTARFTQVGNDEDGYVGTVTLHNPGSAAPGWTVTMTAPGAGQVTVAGGGVTLRRDGDALTFTGPELDAGGTFTYSFAVAGPLSGPLGGCSVNGAACS